MGLLGVYFLCSSRSRSVYKAGMVCTVLPPLFLFRSPVDVEFPVKVSGGPLQSLIALIGGESPFVVVGHE